MLAINQLIKIIIGVIVIAVVITGLYFFGSYVSDFFGNLVPGEDEEKPESPVITEKFEDLQDDEKDTQDSEGFMQKSWDNVKSFVKELF